MSTKRRKARRGNFNRRDQRRVTQLVTLLFSVCMVAIVMMAVVNRLPIGKRYTYTEASDIWIVEDGEMQIAAPEVILFTQAPAATPLPTQTPTAAPTQTPTAIPTQAPAPAAEMIGESEPTHAPSSEPSPTADFLLIWDA